MKRKYSVLIRYYNYVCKKLSIARNAMNEADITKWKAQKMKYMFVDCELAKDYAKHGLTSIAHLP